MNAESITIAIASRNQDFRRKLCNLIASFEDLSVVQEESNGTRLYNKLCNEAVLPAVCMLDMNTSVEDCLRTLKKIRMKWPHIKVIVLIGVINMQISMIDKLHPDGILMKSGTLNNFKKDFDDIYFGRGRYPESLSSMMIHYRDFPVYNPRELQFLTLCCSQMSYQEIATKMNVMPRSVEGYRNILFRKLNVNTRAGLILSALKNKLVSTDDIDI